MMTDATKMEMMTMKALTPGDKGRSSGSASVDIDVREARYGGMQVRSNKGITSIQKHLKICSEML